MWKKTSHYDSWGTSPSQENCERPDDAKSRKARLAKPEWWGKVQVYEINSIFDYPEGVCKGFRINGPFPSPAESVDFLLGVPDAFKLLSGKFCLVIDNLVMVPTIYRFVASGKIPAEDLEAQDCTETNSCLLVWVPLLISILAVEVKFRTNKYILVGNVKQIFLQVEMGKQDRDFLWFLWKNPEAKGEAEVWRWKAITYGISDTPFSAQMARKRLAAM